MVVRIRMPTTGYAPGEWLTAAVNLNTDATSVDVVQLKLILKRVGIKYKLYN